MSLIKNTWYVAAWADEVTLKDMMVRSILSEPVLMYRDDEGKAIAMRNICQHRFASLHLGKKLKGGVIECPYHGLQYGPDGKCVHNPHGNQKIPASARVNVYPLVERDGILWIWMGDTELANPDLIPDFSFLNPMAGWVYTNGVVQTFPVAYELVLDNLMDLSHAAYIHPGTVGAEFIGRGEMKLEELGETSFLVKNWYPSGVPSTAFTGTKAVAPDQVVNMWVDVRWNAPGALFFDTGVIPEGKGMEDSRCINSAQLLTPETESSMHYFWKAYINYMQEDPEVIQTVEQAIVVAFGEQDKPMIADVQRNMGGRDLWDLKPVLLPTDAAAVKARRVLDAMKKQELPS